MFPSISRWWLPNCTFPSVQYLAKQLPNSDVAVLLMNNGNVTADLTISFASVPGLSAASTVAVRDIWAHADLPQASGSFTAANVGSRDSVFLRLSPVTVADRE